MSNLFLQLLNMSITAGWLVMAVLAIRLIFRKAPKALLCALWAIVALRLVCPFSIESAISFVPNAEPIPQDILLSPAPQIDSGIAFVDEALNPIITETFAPEVGASVNPLQVITAIAANVWFLGVIAMLLYALISYLLVFHKTRVRLPLERHVYLCDSIDTPFIFGIVRPRIYLPSTLNQADAAHVLAHERAHLKRRDHWWKPLGFLFLAIYWFNPMIWLAYILLCRDIELACDEHVLSRTDKAQTAAYSEALLHCSCKKRFISACPLAFGEQGVKARIKYALSYKKPAFWIVTVSLLASLLVTCCFLTNPPAADAKGAASELDGVSLSVEDLNLSAEQPYVTVKWQNKSDLDLIYGEAFRLYRLEDGVLVDTATTDAIPFESIGYALRPHTLATKAYTLTGHDLSQNGLYRLESAVSLNSDDATVYTVWVNIEITDGRMVLPPIAMAPNAFTCQHQWIHASCTAPQTCMLCQTVQGDPLGHDWVNATCETPTTCQRCAFAKDDALGHKYENVTCTDGGNCQRCDKAGTETLPHTYSDATCVADATCTACGAVGKKALGHNFSEATCTEDGVCSRCKEIGSYAHGHDYTAATCTEPSICTYCGDLGERNPDRHMYGPDGFCTFCKTYNPEEDLFKAYTERIVEDMKRGQQIASYYESEKKDSEDNKIPLFGDEPVTKPSFPSFSVSPIIP